MAEAITRIRASTRPTETGITYYTFNQVNNSVRVFGSSVKLIVDKNGKAIGIVSAVVPGIKEPANMDAKLSAEEAEAIVKEKFKDIPLKTRNKIVLNQF